MSWRLALVTLGCVLFLMLGGTLNDKMNKGYQEIDEKQYKDANLLTGDAILNYRNSCKLATDKALVKTYQNYIAGPVK